MCNYRVFIPTMECVVCERSSTIVKLVTVSHNKVCGSCKTAYYRGLTKLFEYIFFQSQTNSLINLDCPTHAEHLVWQYLYDQKNCLRQTTFESRQSLCEFHNKNKNSKSHVPCTHCRFRKMVITMKSLAINKCSKNNAHLEKISVALCIHSFRIIQFCLEKIAHPVKKDAKEVSIKNEIKTDENNAQIQKITVNNPSLSVNIDFNPVNDLHNKLSNYSQNDWIQGHLHNRFMQTDKILLVDLNEGKWMTQTGQIPSSRIHSIHNQLESFSKLDKQIFGNLLKTVLFQQINESKLVLYGSHDKMKVEIESFINECIPVFHQTLIYIRCLASENEKGDLQAAPYGKVCFSKPMVFKQLTLEYGMKDAENHFKYGIPVISIKNIEKRKS